MNLNNNPFFYFNGRVLLIFICSFIFLISCSKHTYTTHTPYLFKSISGIPDYNNLNYWAAHPWKKDPSDSVPQPLMAGNRPDSIVDVFFLHPTTLTDKADLRWNAEIDDAEINLKTDYSSMLYQASVFNEHCRVFAPRYRQAHIKSFFIPDSVAAPYFEIAYDDIKTAFINYLSNFNNGRPVIIASHSQGTKHAARLLREFFENKPLQKQLVCAYLIGMPVPVTYFTAIPPCADSLSTNCFVSWRTFKSGYGGGEYIQAEKFKSVVINPLIWTNDSVFVPASKNKGGILIKFNKVVPAVVNAKIHQNILWSGKPDVPGKIFFTRKNFHIGDINLFYLNIRENITCRINAFFQNQHPLRKY